MEEIEATAEAFPLVSSTSLLNVNNYSDEIHNFVDNNYETMGLRYVFPR